MLFKFILFIYIIGTPYEMTTLSYNGIFSNGLSWGGYSSFERSYYLTCHINLAAGKLYALISSATINTKIIIVFPDVASCHGQGQES